MFGPTNRPRDMLENRRQLPTREEHSEGTIFGAAMPVAKVRQLAQHQSPSPQCELNVELPGLWGDQPGPRHHASQLWLGPTPTANVYSAERLIFSTTDCFAGTVCVTIPLCQIKLRNLRTIVLIHNRDPLFRTRKHLRHCSCNGKSSGSGGDCRTQITVSDCKIFLQTVQQCLHATWGCHIHIITMSPGDNVSSDVRTYQRLVVRCGILTTSRCHRGSRMGRFTHPHASKTPLRDNPPHELARAEMHVDDWVNFVAAPQPSPRR